MLCRNASLYDPYWSVAPIVLIICFIGDAGRADMIDGLYIAVFFIWGSRLTLNWAIGWRGMAHQDWRYTMLRQKNPKLWGLTNFFGINMMPTLFVFVNMLSPYLCAAYTGKSLNAISVAGALICLGAVALQIVSDSQMMRFRKDPAHKGLTITSGLWRYSRHPNYLSEVAFWWGVWLIQMGVLGTPWRTAAAPVLMTLLFMLISIPMMENRLSQTKSNYDGYQKSTSMLLLWPPKRATAANGSDYRL